jgi:hypothetical protein
VDMRRGARIIVLAFEKGTPEVDVVAWMERCQRDAQEAGHECVVRRHGEIAVSVTATEAALRALFVKKSRWRPRCLRSRGGSPRPPEPAAARDQMRAGSR